MKEKDAILFFSSINTETKAIDLTSNKIGKLGILKLENMIDNY